MTQPTEVEAVRLALNAVATATPKERRHRLCDLMTAGVALSDLVARQHHWLIRADQWLENNPDHVEYRDREDRYLREIKRYQDAHTVLGAALKNIGEETD